MSISESLFCLDSRINSKTLTRLEAAFIFPYLSSKVKDEYEKFFEKNRYATFDSYYYIDYSPSAFEDEYRNGLTIDREFYKILTKNEKYNLTVYSLKTMYYLRKNLFESQEIEIYVKRFKQLCLALMRTKNPDYMKIYCMLAIILEYGEKMNILKELLYRIEETNIYEACLCPEIFNLYIKIVEKYSLFNESGFKEYK